MKLTQKRLKELVAYDPETGVLSRTTTVHYNAKSGDIAGYVSGAGYMYVSLDGSEFLCHRLAFLYMRGYFPENDIDHINRNKQDNRWCNLREVSRTCNSRNTGNRKNNKSGVKGVFWAKKENKWCAQITINSVGRTLCFNKDFTEAVCHRLAAEQAVDWVGCYDQSPAFKYIKTILTSTEGIPNG